MRWAVVVVVVMVVVVASSPLPCPPDHFVQHALENLDYAWEIQNWFHLLAVVFSVLIPVVGHRKQSQTCQGHGWSEKIPTAVVDGAASEIDLDGQLLLNAVEIWISALQAKSGVGRVLVLEQVVASLATLLAVFWPLQPLFGQRALWLVARQPGLLPSSPLWSCYRASAQAFEGVNGRLQTSFGARMAH